MKPTTYIYEIKRALTPDLLKREYLHMAVGGHPTAGHCYAAAEALWHLLGGPKSQPMRVREPDGMTHWWLEHRRTGEIADPTAEQYSFVGEDPPYAEGRSGGFLTREPSKRAAEIMRRVLQNLAVSLP